MERTACLKLIARLLLVAVVAGFPVSARAGSAKPQVAAVNMSDGVALKGYDPVAYFITGHPTRGVNKYMLRYNGATYLFASAENQSRFKAEPEKYVPQYGGYCAYAMSLNRIADIDPSRWSIVDGKLYLNNGYIAQKLWSLNKSGNIVSGDRNWSRYPKKLSRE